MQLFTWINEEKAGPSIKKVIRILLNRAKVTKALTESISFLPLTYKYVAKAIKTPYNSLLIK